jgi:hypothetical protein
MNAPRHREIACAIIIDTCGRFLLQQRDDIPGIVSPGMVGLFGVTVKAMRRFCNAWFGKYTKRSATSWHPSASITWQATAVLTLMPKVAQFAVSFSLLGMFPLMLCI